MDLLCCHNYDGVELYILSGTLDKSVEEVKQMIGSPCHKQAVTIYKGYALCQEHYTKRLAEELKCALNIGNIYQNPDLIK